MAVKTLGENSRVYLLKSSSPQINADLKQMLFSKITTILIIIMNMHKKWNAEIWKCSAFGPDMLCQTEVSALCQQSRCGGPSQSGFCSLVQRLKVTAE